MAAADDAPRRHIRRVLTLARFHVHRLLRPTRGAYSKFGHEPTHTCLIGHAAPPRLGAEGDAYPHQVRIDRPTGVLTHATRAILLAYYESTLLHRSLAQRLSVSAQRQLRALLERARQHDARSGASTSGAADVSLDDVLADLDTLLVTLEESLTRAGATVHWARDAAEANRIALEVVRAKEADEVVKVKSMATQEIELNEALEEAGVHAWETDLAELIVQLGHDRPSHILVPAIHRNRSEIREIFLREMAAVGRPAPEELTDDPTVTVRERCVRERDNRNLVAPDEHLVEFYYRHTGGVRYEPHPWPLSGEVEVEFGDGEVTLRNDAGMSATYPDEVYRDAR